MFRRNVLIVYFASVVSLSAQVPIAGYHGLRLPTSFFAGNRERLMQQLRNMGPGTLAIIKSMPEQPRNGDGEQTFRQDSDFYYLTGVEEPGAVALLSTVRT